MSIKKIRSIKNIFKTTSIIFFDVLYLKPQIVPNLPIGIDEHSEVDMEWKGVSFHNHDKSRGRSLYNHEARNIKCENSMEEEQSTRLIASWYVCANLKLLFDGLYNHRQQLEPLEIKC